ncbi:hypothetical protein IMCC3135_09690 [Granulosicoccus antarcticus IMCC3135]|uniref:Uncharacterized protein n=1 Tax=Granulosicoccus antarcticus IMCC3135 TaxID=1192854 RepID=A0A2Z2NY15_9GAMM|nr:hypothetical protein IMCC3135_09690 [Granulosicoccus antarcticus IMCC3135]
MSTQYVNSFTPEELALISLLTLFSTSVYSRAMTHQAKQLTSNSDRSWPAFYRRLDSGFAFRQSSIKPMIQATIETNNTNRNGHALTGKPVC